MCLLHPAACPPPSSASRHAGRMEVQPNYAAVLRSDGETEPGGSSGAIGEQRARARAGGRRRRDQKRALLNANGPKSYKA